MNEIINNIYCPRAVAYAGTEHASEGGGGIYVSADEAVALGATEITFGADGYGWATWPQHYWKPVKFIVMKVTGSPGDRRIYGGF